MLIVFNDIRRLVHFEFVPHSITVHAKFYVEVLKRLKRRVYRVQPDIADNWKLHTDIVSVHTAFLVIRFLTESKVQRPPPPPPTVLALLLPRLKTPMKGHHFGSVGKVKEAYIKALKYIPEKAYRDAFDA